MADIKTRDTLKGSVKTLNKAVVGTQKVKHAYISTKDKTDDAVEPRENTAEEYATDRASEGASKTAQKGAQITQKAVKKGTEKAKNEIEKKIQSHAQKRVEKQAESRIRSTANKSIRTAEQTEKTIRQSATSAGKRTIKTVRTIGQQSAKTVQRSVKTAEKTQKATIKTAKASAKAAQKTAKASAKAAQKAAQAAREAAKAAAKATKVMIKALISAIKAIVAGVKALIAACAAGGWVAVVVIIVLCLIGLIVGSVFGIFTPQSDIDSGLTMQQAVQEINSDWEQHIESEKKKYTYDNLVMEGEKAKWKEVIAIYAVKKNMASANQDPSNPPDEVVTMTQDKLQDLKYIFWEMNSYSSRLESKTVQKEVEEKDDKGKTKKVKKSVTEKTLYITITHRDLDSMMNRNCFTEEQKEMCRELLKDKYNALWAELLSGISYDDSDIVKLAQEQIGNSSGQKYWSWYGFPSRVEWCACFVSWCGAQCGYIDEGVFPKYSVCDDGVSFFKSKGGWLSGSETPQPGMIIFFDWEDDGLDGNSDHTGIVVKAENGIVYTIEGNSGDKVCERQYSVGHKEILGYGSYEQHNNSISGDVATQVWKHLKSYGYSDSVAAGIIGNMMRECGGDTLDLDWDVVGHFNGDEFYGLCQWCLRYAPSGFKGASIKKQCDYLHQTIKSEFANYGGNYNGITYSQFLKSDTRTAAIAFERVYERCGDYSNEDSRRANNAEKAYNKFHK